MNSLDSTSNLSLEIKGSGLKDLKKIKLVNFKVPNVIYNIKSGINNYIVWNQGETDYSALITPGQYMITSLLGLIQTLINSADANTYVYIYNSNIFLSTISGAGVFTLNWATNPVTTSCCKELRWTFANISHISLNVISLEEPTYIFMNIQELFITPYYTSNTSAESNKFAFCISLLKFGGELIYTNENNSFENEIHFNHSITLINLKIRILDKTESEVNLLEAN